MKTKSILLKIFYMIPIIGIILLASCDNDRSNKADDNEGITKEELQAKARIAGKEGRELMQIIEEEPGTRSSGSAYPDYFGGIYLDENFDIVLVIVDDNPEKFRSMAEEKVKSVNLHLQKGDFSLNKLEKIQEKLDDFFRNSAPKSIKDNLISAGIEIQANRISVEFIDIGPDKINEFKEAFMDSPAIIFKQGTGPFIDLTNVNPGSGIKPPGLNNGSVGYRARNSSNQIGVVSSGHLFTIVGQGAYINNVHVGQVANRQYFGTVDAAFIRITNSSYIPTNVVDVTGQILITTTIPLPGEPAALRGINGTYNGFVRNTSRGVSGPGGVYINDLIEIGPASATAGDSGGIAYVGSFILGIIKGVASGNTYVCKAANINSAFGISHY
ncbi:hypothetical protein [Proteiniphilum sp. UBA5346]|uniref:hypothetical protein n=1 Tax=Proteiniphilum sp. UBA5346 TaxID=1947277 RepID=UPI00257EF3BE|nr:hypothetical protein [Proteiniphilum sp. UBA5346]